MKAPNPNLQLILKELKLYPQCGYSYMTLAELLIYLVIPTPPGCGILVPQPGIEPRPLAIQVPSPNPGPSGNSLMFLFLMKNIYTVRRYA